MDHSPATRLAERTALFAAADAVAGNSRPAVKRRATPAPRAPRALKPRSWTVRVRHELSLPIAALCITGSSPQQAWVNSGSLQSWAKFDFDGAATQALDAPRYLPTGSVSEFSFEHGGTVYHELAHSQTRLS